MKIQKFFYQENVFENVIWEMATYYITVSSLAHGIVCSAPTWRSKAELLSTGLTGTIVYEIWTKIQKISFNSLCPSDTIWRQRSGSTLARVMACCLAAPSHYLNQFYNSILRSPRGQWVNKTYFDMLLPRPQFMFSSSVQAHLMLSPKRSCLTYDGCIYVLHSIHCKMMVEDIDIFFIL